MESTYLQSDLAVKVKMRTYIFGFLLKELPSSL